MVREVMSQPKPKSTRTLAFFFIFAVAVVVFLNVYYVQTAKKTPDYEAPHLNLDVSLQEENEQEMDKLSVSLGQIKALLNYTSKIESSARELQQDLRSRLMKIKENKSFDGIDALIEDFSQNEESILANVQSLKKLLKESDSMPTYAKKLTDFVQNQLHQLQNPPNCATAKKLLCSTSRTGVAYNSHHLMYCFMMAYWTGRTFVMKSKDWHYAPGIGWEGAFLPLSEKCKTAGRSVVWAADRKNHQVVSLPDINRINPKPPFMPQAIPKVIADDLFQFHGNPFAWFAGQFFLYLTRPNEKFKQFLADRKKALNITRPYVGIHVRRTDKIKEEKYHDLDEYMVHVEEWYQSYGRTNKMDKKRIFIATDEPKVIAEAKANYTDYEVYATEDIAGSAKLESRYNLNSLFGFVSDLHILAESDYVVCTYTSNVGRLLYEFMQTFHVDGSKKCYSLEPKEYFFWCQITDEAVAM
jgi:glycoprotein 6-alpha-L-fucosyltransferase